MRAYLIKKIDIRIISKTIGYKLNYSSRVNFVPSGFINVAYLMVSKKEKFNLCEIMKQKLLDNMDRLKKTMNVVFRFESLMIHLFFKVTR